MASKYLVFFFYTLQTCLSLLWFSFFIRYHIFSVMKVDCGIDKGSPLWPATLRPEQCRLTGTRCCGQSVDEITTWFLSCWEEVSEFMFPRKGCSLGAGEATPDVTTSLSDVRLLLKAAEAQDLLGARVLQSPAGRWQHLTWWWCTSCL